MSRDFLILMAGAVVVAAAIGWFISDKLGLIKNLKIDDKPSNDGQDTNKTEKQRFGSDKHSKHQNNHNPTDKIG